MTTIRFSFIALIGLLGFAGGVNASRAHERTYVQEPDDEPGTASEGEERAMAQVARLEEARRMEEDRLERRRAQEREEIAAGKARTILSGRNNEIATLAEVAAAGYKKEEIVKFIEDFKSMIERGTRFDDRHLFEVNKEIFGNSIENLRNAIDRGSEGEALRLGYTLQSALKDDKNTKATIFKEMYKLKRELGIASEFDHAQKHYYDRG